jgi:hypothetical protein
MMLVLQSTQYLNLTILLCKYNENDRALDCSAEGTYFNYPTLVVANINGVTACGKCARLKKFGMNRCQTK